MVALFLFCGCDVVYGSYMNDDGSYVRKVEVDMSPDSDEEIASENEVDSVVYELEKIYNDEMLGKKEYGKVEIDEEDGDVIRLIYEYDSMTDYYISMGLDGSEKNESNSDEYDQGFYTYSTSNYASDLTAEIVDSYAFYYFYTYSTLINKPYNEMWEQDLNVYSQYGTKYTKTFTANTTNINTEDKNMTLYTWELNPNTDVPMTLMSKSPNTKIWYGLAICISIVVASLMVIVNMLFRGKKNGQN